MFPFDDGPRFPIEPERLQPLDDEAAPALPRWLIGLLVLAIIVTAAAAIATRPDSAGECRAATVDAGCEQLKAP